jgi:hypothetical protein
MLRTIASCADNAERISRRLDAPLSAGARLALFIHLAGCRSCRRYTRQLRFLHEIFPRVNREWEQMGLEVLPAARRQVIKDLLRQLP